jgi:hypothetical protein
MTSHNKQKALLSRPRKKKIENEESWRPESEGAEREDEETASCAVSSSEEKEKQEEKQEVDQKEVTQRTSACEYRGSKEMFSKKPFVFASKIWPFMLNEGMSCCNLETVRLFIMLQLPPCTCDTSIILSLKDMYNVHVGLSTTLFSAELRIRMDFISILDHRSKNKREEDGKKVN